MIITYKNGDNCTEEIFDRDCFHTGCDGNYNKHGVWTPFYEPHHAKYTETDWGSSVTAEIWAYHPPYNPYVFYSAIHRGESDCWAGVSYASDLYMYCETEDYYYSVSTPGSSVVSYGPEGYYNWAKTTVKKEVSALDRSIVVDNGLGNSLPRTTILLNRQTQGML